MTPTTRAGKQTVQVAPSSSSSSPPPQEGTPLVVVRRNSSVLSEGSTAVERTATAVVPSNNNNNILRTTLWSIQILIGFAVIVWAMIQNGNDCKYIPIKLAEFEGQACDRAFANVMSLSADEDGAIQCCHDDNFAIGPCAVSRHSLPLERRLTNFPEAWVYPLFPWLYRFIWEILEQQQQSATTTDRNRFLMRALQRLGVYIGIMLFRGWVLYVGFNILEARWATTLNLTPLDDDDDDDEQHLMCWYKNFLKSSSSVSSQSSCYGRLFDFSDHVVFYFVQVLCIVWTEYLDAYFCYNSATTTTTHSNNNQHFRSVPLQQQRSGISPGIFCLTAVVTYMHLIVYVGVYKTARWFHTASEILVGWFISLLVTLLVTWTWPWLFPPPASKPSLRHAP